MADAVLEDIKNRLDIVDVLSGYIQLKKSGTNFKAVCPFHNEKTPSLMVSPQKQIWHCFGCNEGGDIFGFVMRYENLEFREALKMLADRAGVKLPERSSFSRQTEDLKEQLYKINGFAAEFYHRQLKTSGAKHAQDYLLRRGLAEETIDKWRIGFAPDDFHSLEKALVAKGATIDNLIKAGVSIKGERGNIYDRFRNRITFPIYNYVGDVVGFTARTLDPNEKGAKYINSPETLVYNKSEILFGLNFAKGDIRKNDNVVIVEGQMDCISCHEAGFTNVVASSGTALTAQHLRQLSRLTKNLKFCFDADSAGQAASRRAGELALSMGFAVKVVTLPSGKDPDELIRKDLAAWKKALGSSVWFIDFYLERGLVEFPSNSLEQKKYLAASVVPLLSFVQDPLELDHYIQKIGQAYGVAERALKEQLGKQNRSEINTVAELKPPVKQGSSAAVSLEKQVLGGLLYSKEFLLSFAEIGSADDFTDPEMRELAALVLTSEVAEQVKGMPLAKEAEFVVESELASLDGNSVALINELRKSAYMLRLGRIKREQGQLVEAVRAAEISKDAAKLKQLQVVFADLSRQRVALENKINKK